MCVTRPRALDEGEVRRARPGRRLDHDIEVHRIASASALGDRHRGPSRVDRQDGLSSWSFGLLVRSRWPVPSAFMTQMSAKPSLVGWRVKAMDVPSGDQAGQESTPDSEVSRVTFLPSTSMT